jgi:hypothetical protein
MIGEHGTSKAIIFALVDAAFAMSASVIGPTLVSIIEI